MDGIRSMIEQYLYGLKVPEDELTALERSRLLSEGKEADRILCCIDSGETLAPLIGCTLKEYYFSSEKMCVLEGYIYERYQSDGAGISITLRGMAEAMGTKIKYSDYNIAQVETPAISSLDEIDRLELVDVERDGRLPIILEGLSLVQKTLGDKVPVSGTVTGPFTVAAMLVGAETLLKGMVRHPDQVLQMMEIITENNNRYIQRLLDMGVGVGFADPMSSTSLLRVSQYEKFAVGESDLHWNQYIWPGQCGGHGRGETGPGFFYVHSGKCSARGRDANGKSIRCASLRQGVYPEGIRFTEGLCVDIRVSDTDEHTGGEYDGTYGCSTDLRSLSD